MNRKYGDRARFVASDIVDLPADLRSGDFDIVYTGGGALCVTRSG